MARHGATRRGATRRGATRHGDTQHGATRRGATRPARGSRPLSAPPAAAEPPASRSWARGGCHEALQRPRSQAGTCGTGGVFDAPHTWLWPVGCLCLTLGQQEGDLGRGAAVWVCRLGQGGTAPAGGRVTGGTGLRGYWGHWERHSPGLVTLGTLRGGALTVSLLQQLPGHGGAEQGP